MKGNRRFAHSAKKTKGKCNRRHKVAAVSLLAQGLTKKEYNRVSSDTISMRRERERGTS